MGRHVGWQDLFQAVTTYPSYRPSRGKIFTQFGWAQEKLRRAIPRVNSVTQTLHTESFSTGSCYNIVYHCNCLIMRVWLPSLRISYYQLLSHSLQLWNIRTHSMMDRAICNCKMRFRLLDKPQENARVGKTNTPA